MSHWIRRTNPETGRESWTGPLRSPRQAEREVTAWRAAGWLAEAIPSSPEVRAKVRAWEKANRGAASISTGIRPRWARS